MIELRKLNNWMTEKGFSKKVDSPFVLYYKEEENYKLKIQLQV